MIEMARLDPSKKKSNPSNRYFNSEQLSIKYDYQIAINKETSKNHRFTV